MKLRNLLLILFSTNALAQNSTSELELCYNYCLREYVIQRNQKCITRQEAIELDDQMTQCFLPCDVLNLIENLK